MPMPDLSLKSQNLNFSIPLRQSLSVAAHGGKGLENPAGILLFRHSSIIFPQKGNKSIYQKRAVGSHRNTSPFVHGL